MQRASLTPCLGYAQAREPSSAQCFVELNDRHQMEAVCCRKGKFGIEQIPFSKEHIHVARDTALVAEIGDIQSRAQGVDLLFLRLPLILNCSNSHQGIFNFLECHQDGLLILSQ